ncbi:hypothetical protein MWU57_03630 [Isoptericola sp. S6320L]|uniref:hypothetical protein n=1 Tax=Isoptericola sp. S6320L TaxID=2926411 RepID=UPI001FF43AAD|nr:hypothetical protein [Isoptericola sp. S6320L]MCK0116113.1 hypothetical protein [Isoptericola sp. S6320L]
MTTHHTTQHSSSPTGGTHRRRPSHRVESLAVLWWVAGLVVALVHRWAVGSAAGATEPLNHGLLRDVPVDTLATGVAVFAAVGAALAAWMRWSRSTARGPRVVVAVGTGVVLLAAVLLVDATVLAGLGYLPALLVTSLFSAEVRASLDHYVAPDFLFQTAVLCGAVLLAVAAVRSTRRSRGACVRCGRRHDGVDAAWTTPAAAARWGRVAALVAAAVPAFYGLTRIAWALGIPLGYSRDSVESMRGLDFLGPVGLGTFALLGAVLTLGLYQRWGDVFPRWMLGLAGKRVPVGLAVVPATVVAVTVLPAGTSMIALGLTQGVLGLGAETWGAVGPAFLWPLWSLALGAATYAYWLRRRGICPACGRG